MKEKGQLSLEIIIISAVVIILVSGFAVWAAALLTLSSRDYNRALAFSIAESGIEYYRWHLAHAPTDYKDGTGLPGPYLHTYTDKDGNILGTFTLTITPPPLGSRVVTVRSAGSVMADPTVQKIIQVRLGIPSLAKYAFVLNAAVRFGLGTEVFGPIHSNGGVRFDGKAHNLVTSAVQNYTDSDFDACTANSYGVHTCVSPADPAPPGTLQSHTDVFIAGRQFPVPAVDFSGFTQNLSQMKTDAQAGGFYASSSGASGYEVIFKTNNTFDLYKVTALTTPPGSCTNSLSQSGWGTWSIKTETFLANNPMPANGIIFIEDNVWARGQINGARVTLASGVFPDNPSTRTSITLNTDLLYTKTDGSEVIGLVAQNNVNVGLVSSDTMQVDAALIAQNGRVGRYYYSSNCGATYKRSSITIFGMIASSLRYGFAYTDGTGYQTRNINYDANLLFGPPPSFPLTGDQYVPVSWDEVK